MMYTVGEIAKKLNVTASTLRYYDKEGLLPFVKRSDGGMRIFGDEDMSSLKVIECLKKTGMPIKEIKHFMDCCLAGDDKIGERLAVELADRRRFGHLGGVCLSCADRSRLENRHHRNGDHERT